MNVPIYRVRENDGITGETYLGKGETFESLQEGLIEFTVQEVLREGLESLTQPTKRRERGIVEHNHVPCKREPPYRIGRNKASGDRSRTGGQKGPCVTSFGTITSTPYVGRRESGLLNVRFDRHSVPEEKPKCIQSKRFSGPGPHVKDR